MATTKPSPAAAPPPSTNNISEEEEEEEDDYLSMTISEPIQPLMKETYTARRERLRREAEAKNPKSKSQLAAEAEASRLKALSTSIPETSKGFKMLSKFGFQAGDSLGPRQNGEARKVPVEVDMKIDRGGIGMDSERKRKVREEAEKLGAAEKKVRVEEGDYRERIGREREMERVERMVAAAQRVAERMDEEDEQEDGELGVAEELAPVVEEKEGLLADQGVKKTTKVPKTKPTRQINVLWRGLARARQEKERDRRMRYDLMQSLSKDREYNDANEQDKDAFGTIEEELEEEDPELDQFNALEPAERLGKLVGYLRERWHYCFWCKHRYEDEKMEGCPGLTEDDHD